MQSPDEDYGYARFFAAIDTVVLGRATYDHVLTFPEWPFTDRRVSVLTNRQLAARHGERAHIGPLAPLLARLHAEGARRVYLDGGTRIVRDCMKTSSTR